MTESAPSVRPWKPPSSATTPGLPVALRAYLSAASIGLGARVAEERLRSAEASRRGRGELLRGLGAVEVRRVPEALELRLRRGERRRMAMAERDDRDPAAEVEVLAPVRVPDAAARRRARS